MKKHTINDWAQDCANIGKQMRRYAHANACLPDDMLRDEWNKTVATIQAFANKYSVDYETAEKIAAIISDGVELGLAY